MAGRIFRAIDCYPHEPTSNQPRLEIMLYNVADETWPHLNVLAPVDTGFSGAVMLSEQDYQFFMLGEFPKRFWKAYRTMTGPLQTRVARAFVKTGESEALEETQVETPAFGPGKLLVGRAILRKHRLLIDGSTACTCLMEQAASNRD